MCDHHGVRGFVVQINDSQVPVPQAMESHPFARHWFGARNVFRVQRELFKPGQRVVP